MPSPNPPTHKSRTRRSRERIPTTPKPTPSPITPAYALALQNLFRRKSYNSFHPPQPYSKTRTNEALCGKACGACSIQDGGASSLRRWRGEQEHNLGIYSTDGRMMVPARNTTSPCWEAEKRGTRPSGSAKKKPGAKKKGFPPVLMRVFACSTVTKSALPAPWCDMSERTFQAWFVASMATLGVGAEFSLSRLAAMAREEERQSRAAVRREEELGPKETLMMYNLLAPKPLQQMLDKEMESYRPELNSELVRQIKEQLRCIEEERRAARLAIPGYAERERRVMRRREQRARNEAPAMWFVQKCKAGLRALWVF